MGELKASSKSFLGPLGQLRPPLPITLLGRSPPSAGSLGEVPQTEQGTGAPRTAFPSSTPPLLLRRDVARVIWPRGVREDLLGFRASGACYIFPPPRDVTSAEEPGSAPRPGLPSYDGRSVEGRPGSRQPRI